MELDVGARWRRRALLAVLFAAALGASHAAAQPVGRCTAAKLKAAGTYFKALARCAAKEVSDLSCVTKAQAKLAQAFAKAEKKPDCPATGDQSTVELVIDHSAGDVASILEPPPATCCAVSGPVCFWEADAATCSALGGTPGAAGSVCSGAGTCDAPPATPGPCCKLVSYPLPALNGKCIAQSTLTASVCEGGGGDSFVANGFCIPAQRCVD